MAANATGSAAESSNKARSTPLTRGPSADDLRRAGIRTSVLGLIGRLPAVVRRPLRVFESSPPPQPSDGSSSRQRLSPPPSPRSSSPLSASSSALGKHKADSVRRAAPPPEPRRKRHKRKPITPSAISYDMYPHIVEAILKHADVASLIASRGTCHALQALADQRLQRSAESDPRHGTPPDRRLSWVHGTHRHTRLPRYTAIGWVYVHGPATAPAANAEKIKLVVPPGTHRLVVYIAFTVSSASVKGDEAKELHSAIDNILSIKWAERPGDRPRFVGFIFVPDYLRPASTPPPRSTVSRDYNPFRTEGYQVLMPGMLGDLAHKFNRLHLVPNQGAVRFIGLELLTPTLIQSNIKWPQLHGEQLSLAVIQATRETFKRYLVTDEWTVVQVRAWASRLMAETRKF
ncbi:uncharacterized protein LOC62_01G001610 [Vanrija pseudolonga]|uniref:Uncharacterized protein n=1 Tax=Vanrija pseudolonga TaxID=143232 RepID=A0AAF1BG25_9TREE|nr:hypothetical protein LOC62_01G001610 [Vanrija pseudolonga]